MEKTLLAWALQRKNQLFRLGLGSTWESLPFAVMMVLRNITFWEITHSGHVPIWVSCSMSAQELHVSSL